MSDAPSESSPQAAQQTPPLALAALVMAAVACGAGLVATAIGFRYFHSPAVFKFASLLGLIAAISALASASFASRRIQGSNGTLGGEKLILTSRLLVGALFIWALLGPIFAPSGHGDSRGNTASALRQIGQASLIFANDNREVLPPATIKEDGAMRHPTLHDVARQLAQNGGLNDASLWFSRQDKAVPKETFGQLSTVYDRKHDRLHPDFARQQVFSFDYVTGLRTSLPSRTPIAWTRGLRLDGTWDPEGVYGTDGGHVVFLGGSVKFFKNLGLIGTDSRPTTNILDTLPPGARIVGAGPATLNGYFKSGEPKPAEAERKRVARFPNYERPRIRVARSSRETNAAKFLAIGTASRAFYRQRGYPPVAISGGHGVRLHFVEDDVAVVLSNPAGNPDEHVVRPLTIHDVAMLLAGYAGLTDAQAWFSPTDPRLPDSAKTQENVLDPETGEIDPDFAAQRIISVDYVTGLTSEVPPTTPLAWSRGLQENGQWHRDGASGNDGGYILFVDGNVWYYDTLGSMTVRLTSVDGEPTTNILDTLPSGARIVGAGPATLNGRTASERSIPQP